jgi:hypothetical protein
MEPAVVIPDGIIQAAVVHGAGGMNGYFMAAPGQFPSFFKIDHVQILVEGADIDGSVGYYRRGDKSPSGPEGPDLLQRWIERGIGPIYPVGVPPGHGPGERSGLA